MTQNERKINYGLTLLMLFFLSCGKERRAVQDVFCSKPIPAEFVFFFERGFDKNRVSISINGIRYFDGYITTDNSIELAKEFTFSSDTIKKINLILDENEIVNICPTRYMTINLENGRLKIDAIEKAPDYYE